jgi:hypothetical protein
VLKRVKLILVEHMDEVLDQALLPQPIGDGALEEKHPEKKEEEGRIEEKFVGEHIM